MLKEKTGVTEKISFVVNGKPFDPGKAPVAPTLPKTDTPQLTIHPQNTTK